MREVPKVLIIYTGGTIGMINDHLTGELKSFDFDHIYDNVPELKRLNAELTTVSFDKPVDSSEMDQDMWKQMARTVFDNYAHYDGFVILHGSDTMAYSASALSFMLQGLEKPVIFTGSQLPIGTIRTDGKENLITAIEIAAMKNENGDPMVREVAVYFEYSLYRGNRSSKISANQFEAFASPNYPTLAVAGVTISFNEGRLLRSNNAGLKLTEKMNDRVGLLKIYPGFPVEVYSSLFDRKYTDAVVLETYGSGNAPSNAKFRQLITEYINDGGIVLNTTQCSSGSVQQGKYQTSTFFQQSGVISGADMTTEAALTKLMHLLAYSENKDQIIGDLQKDLVGELTELRNH
jgi:L-asparaginase